MKDKNGLGSSTESVNPSSSYVVLASSYDGTQYLRPAPNPDNRDDDGEPLKFDDFKTIGETIRKFTP